jgi:hypothetical protein
MLACVSPGFSSANHTINTLRYSDRLKEKSAINKIGKVNQIPDNNFIKKELNLKVEPIEVSS